MAEVCNFALMLRCPECAFFADSSSPCNMAEGCGSMLAYGGLQMSSEIISLSSFLYYDYALSAHFSQIHRCAMFETLVSLLTYRDVQMSPETMILVDWCNMMHRLCILCRFIALQHDRALWLSACRNLQQMYIMIH
jgi:hypothetical protein